MIPGLTCSSSGLRCSCLTAYSHTMSQIGSEEDSAKYRLSAHRHASHLPEVEHAQSPILNFIRVILC